MRREGEDRRARELAEETRRINERLIVAGVRMQELADEAEAARCRLVLVADVSRLLGTSLDVASVLPAVAARLTRGFCDACSVDVVAEPDAPAWSVAAPDGGGSDPTSFPSMVALPLESHGRARGVLTLRARRRRYDPADLAIAHEVAERIGRAVERAELHKTTLDAVRARDDLLAAISHDLRNPLNAIVLSAAILSRQAAAGEPTQIATVGRIRRAAEHMERLIQDLVDSVKIGAGRFVVARRPEAMGPLVNEVCEMLAPLAERKSQRLEASVDGALAALPVWMDRDGVARLLSNLVGNAIKFTPEGGSVLVGAARAGDGEVRLSVRDTGPGIAPEDRGRLFDRFWQAKQTAQLGTGLGLFIAREIAEAHGGRIWVESEVGEGSTFQVALPVHAPPSSAG